MYQPDFLSAEEEASLVAEVASLTLSEAHFHQYRARRRVAMFGEGAGDEAGRAQDDGALAVCSPFPPFLSSIRERVAAWRGVPVAHFVQALVTEYQPGVPIGWHRDAPQYGIVVGLSLAAAARMRFRPVDATGPRNPSFAIELAPRSAYVMQGDIRARWQHHIPPVSRLRYSITLRTLVKRVATA
ncbi:MAG: alpha-ketoglutarate-dependent dioxygenase AlkB [Proteobacteria bacterium]|nr:alpha-ketoglutarate-dependent dioxygenase AlkB [Burkholderiales bacterium]